MKFIIALLMVFGTVALAMPPGPTPPTPPAGYTPAPGVTPPPFVKHTPYPKTKPGSMHKHPAKAPNYPKSSEDQVKFVKAFLDKKVKSGQMTQKQEDDAMAHADAVYDAVMKEKKGAK